jgi:signal transduction histidine kinase
METQSAFMAAAAACVLLLAGLARRRDRVGLRYAVLAGAFALYAAGRGVESLGSSAGAALAALALALSGPAAFAFVTALALPTAHERRLRALLWAAGPLVALGALGSGDHARWAVPAVGAFAIACVARAAPVLWRASGELVAGDPPEATRLRYLAVAHGVVVAAALADVGLAAAGRARIGALLAAPGLLWAGYLVLARIRAADLRHLMGNALALALLAGGLAASFALLRAWAGERHDLFLFDAFVTGFLLLLVYEQAGDRIRHWIERRFSPGKVELERALLPLHERLDGIATLDQLLGDLLAALERTDRVTASAIYLRGEATQDFQLAASTGVPSRPRANLIRDAAFAQALDTGEVLLAEELEKSLADARSETRRARLGAELARLRELDAQLVLALRSTDAVIGFWTFTDAQRREPFSTGEVELLRGIARRAARSLENSKAFERIRARDRLVGLGEMAAGLAHEIRNPIAAIRGALTVLEEAGELPRSELSGVIVEEVRRLDRVVGMFLEYGRPSTHRESIDDFAGFLRGCVDAVARRHAREPVALSLEIEPDLPSVTADRAQLETVISNVVQNAYEAVKGAGAIRVAARAEASDSGRGIAISVSDSGPGMDEATLERAFVPFFTTKERGLGLGLALCERLTRAQGGSIELRSKPGEGTSVSIRLPAGRAPESEAA